MKVSTTKKVVIDHIDRFQTKLKQNVNHRCGQGKIGTKVWKRIASICLLSYKLHQNYSSVCLEYCSKCLLVAMFESHLSSVILGLTHTEVLTDNWFICSREPDHHSSDSWRPVCAEPELSCPRARVLQLQQPWQQHPGVSLWTWAADIHCNSECHFVCCSTSWRCSLTSRLTFMDVLSATLYYVHHPLFFAPTADYLSTLSMSSTSLGSDTELTGQDSALWSSAVDLRRGDTKGTLLKVQSLYFPLSNSCWCLSIHYHSSVTTKLLCT